MNSPIPPRESTSAPPIMATVVPVAIEPLEVRRKCIVTTSPLVLPAMCIKCCQPLAAHEMTTKRIRGLPWWFLPVTILNIISPIFGDPFFIIAVSITFWVGFLFFNRRCTVTFGLCERHRRWHLVTQLLLLAVVIYLMNLILARNLWTWWFLWELIVIAFYFATAMVVIFVLYARSKWLRASKYKGKLFWIKGCSRKFLDLVRASCK